jgi:CubicO group peptidase (beta-lactamase class C family)
MRKMHETAEVQGRCDARFEPLRALLQTELDAGNELGVSVSVVHAGRTVVDLHGGHADVARTRPWQRNTLVNVFSTTKTMTGLVALVLVERGLLDPDAPVADYWPEFAVNGKAGVLVRHVLGHTAGVSGLEQPATLEDVMAPGVAAARAATQAPWWAPGSAGGYHALSVGYLVGELVQRVTGRSLGRYFAEEIARPLDADFHIGLAPSEFGRVAELVPPPPLPFDFSQLDPSSPMLKTLTGPQLTAEAAMTPAWRQAEVPAANGHGNARSVARIQAVVSQDGALDGVRLLSQRTIDRVFEEQARNVDLVLGMPLRYGLGYGLPEPVTLPYLPDRKLCFWGGWGGSLVVNDLDTRMTFAYVMNKMQPGVVGSVQSEKVARAVYACLGA